RGLSDPAQVRLHTARIVEDTPVFDMHTHLFPPAFGDLVHWGIDELLTYHYLVAELMRSGDARPEQYYRMPRPAYVRVIENGRPVTIAEMRRDVRRLFADNFRKWTPSRRPA